MKHDALALGGEIGIVARRLYHCDAALRAQHEEIIEARSVLQEALGVQGELRETKLRAESEVRLLRILLEYQQAALTVGGAAASEFEEAMRIQGEELEVAESKLLAHREVESKAFLERRRLWDKCMDEWLPMSYNKRIDLSQGANVDVFNRLRDLLATEQKERQAQIAYLQHAKAAEEDSVHSRAHSRAAWLEEQVLALQQEHNDYEADLQRAIVTHLKEEMDIRDARVLGLEREGEAVKHHVNELGRRHDEHANQRLMNLTRAVDPLLSAAKSRGFDLAERAANLPADHPSAMLTRCKVILEASHEEGRVTRMECDKLNKQLRDERGAHKLARAQLEALAGRMGALEDEYTLKEQYLAEVRQLEEEGNMLDEEMRGRVEDHNNQVSQQERQNEHLRATLSDMRKQHKTMGMSLAQYASLESEWGEKTDARDRTLKRLEKAVKKLRRQDERVVELEAAVAESSHDDVVRLQSEVEQLNTRIELVEGSVKAAERRREEEAANVEDLRENQSVASWMAKEANNEKVQQLEEVNRKLKEGRAVRIVKMRTALKGVGRCLHAWGLYVRKERMRRQLANAPSAALSIGVADVTNFLSDVGNQVQRTTTQVHENVVVAGQQLRVMAGSLHERQYGVFA